MPRPGRPRPSAFAAPVAAVLAVALLFVGTSCSSGSTDRAAGSRSTTTPVRSSPTGPVRSSPTATPVPSATGRAAVTAFTDVTGATTFHPTTVSLAALRRAYPGITFSVRLLRHAGVQRAYLAAAPRRAARGTLPLYVVLSGWHASADFESERTGFLPQVAGGKAVAIYPVGYRESWDVNKTDSCCHDAGRRGLDDAGFVAAATQDATTWLRTDPARSYLVGHSNGARLAFTLACHRADLYAAVATMAAVDQSRCGSTAPPISALVAVGSADGDIPTEDHPRPPVPLLDATAAAFRARDHCSRATTTTRHGVAGIVDSRRCVSGTAVRRIVYSDVRHSWPTAGHYGGATHVAGPIVLATLIEQFVASRHR